MAGKKKHQLLRTDYEQLAPLANRYVLALQEQLEQLLLANGLTLGVPIEHRIKTWQSISNNMERRNLTLKNIRELDDLIGIRLILLFKRDLATINKLIADTFEVIRQEDKATRLDDTQFGYQSVHFVIKLPKEWLEIPSFRDFSQLHAEVQVRTLAQHIWAAAAHKLQYKQEDSVPRPILRSIYRVSAILEIVDLEFERVLQERESYITADDTLQEHAKLNVDLVERILDELLPPDNRDDSELYAELLEDLLLFDIDTVGKLQDLVRANLDKVIEGDNKIVRTRLAEKDYYSTTLERLECGVFFNHVGLVRAAIEIQFGEKRWGDYRLKHRAIVVD